jgi:hypothetical protein
MVMVPVRWIIPILLFSLAIWPFVFGWMLVTGQEIDGGTIAGAVVILPLWVVGAVALGRRLRGT